MTISYGITVCNETEEFTRLVKYLYNNNIVRPEDEIVVVYDQNKIPADLLEYLTYSSEFEHNFSAYPFDFKNDFLENKNYLNTKCTKDYIFQLDADEMPASDLAENLHIILNENPVDLVITSRVNYVDGITNEAAAKWGFHVDENKWVNFPDCQKRVYRNTPDIKWSGHKVHGMIVGFKTYVTLPFTEHYSILHFKTLEKQEAQNTLYATL